MSLRSADFWDQPEAWDLPREWAEEFDPVGTGGWKDFRGAQFDTHFPEVADRRMVWQRDFWLGHHPDQRLVVEWVVPWQRVLAVFRDGVEADKPTTKAEWDWIWRIHGGDGMRACGASCCDGFNRGERMDTR